MFAGMNKMHEVEMACLNVRIACLRLLTWICNFRSDPQPVFGRRQRLKYDGWATTTYGDERSLVPEGTSRHIQKVSYA
jgi:hypothetical protein